MNIGFIGLGMMGYPMAHLLVASGHTLTVMDLNADMAQRFVTEHTGAKVGASPADFVHSDVVITMLPDSNAVEAVVLGDQGLTSVLQNGAAIIDMSSSEPLRSRNLAQQL